MDTLILNRKIYSDTSTVGDLLLDGQVFCQTLEDTCRRNKLPGITAIPPGVYRVVIDYSKRYSRFMPRILDVPGYSGVLIHWGNYPKDTDGCVLVGHYNPSIPNMVTSSRKTFDILFDKLNNRKGGMTIAISGGFPHEPLKAVA